MDVLRAHIETLLETDIRQVKHLSGGDISTAYLLETKTGRFFCKTNSGPRAFSMFSSEKQGLETLGATKAIAVPKVHHVGVIHTKAFLLMEYIEGKSPSDQDMELLGRNLALLHTAKSGGLFGFPSNNFIGSLPQHNTQSKDWAQFYVQERLLPQLKMGYDTKRLSKTEIPSETRLLNVCRDMFPTVRPALLHGDLWGSNFLIAAQGVPFLIDPAVYYGHHEVDLAMTRLFGGFSNAFYFAYSEVVPLTPGHAERQDLYQLYYLLVHLNLFGGGYRHQVLSVLSRYF